MEVGSGVIKKALKRVFEEQNIDLNLFEFYKRICDGRYKYVIIVPRKCLTEYNCVKQADPNLVVSKDTVLMTTKGFIRYRDKIKKEIEDLEELPDNYLAIVDDIMIYGRGINCFMKQMFDSFDSQEIKTKLIKKTYLEIFIESNFDFQFDEEYQEILEERYNCFFSYGQYSAIKRASDLFLKSFYATSIPNTSFVRSWYLSSEAGKTWLDIDNGKVDLGKDIKEAKEVLDLELINIEQNVAQKAEDFHLGFIHSKTHFLDNLCEFKCLRYYYNEKLNRTVFVPYVFLKPLTMNEIDDLLKMLSGLLEDVLSEENDLFAVHEGNVDYSILKYEYLTQIISDLYGMYIWDEITEKLNIKGNGKVTFADGKDALQYSFGDENTYPLSELAEKVDKSWKQKMDETIGAYQVEKSPIYSSKEDEDALKIIEQMLDNGKFIPAGEVSETSRWFVDEYFDRNGRSDEVSAKYKKDKIFGISTESFYQKFKEIVKNENEDCMISLYKEILRCMDSGIAGLRVKAYKIGEVIYIASVLNAGEQSYRIKIDPYMTLFEYCKKIENDCINLHMFSSLEERIDNFLHDAIKDEDSNKADKIKKDIAYLRAGMRAQKSSYSNMFVNRLEGEEDKKRKQKYEEIYHKVMV